MMPARVALALQADGWTLRQDIVWNKVNTMPESVTDRCTKAHEYIFMLAKKPSYFFDATAIAEPTSALTSWKDAGRYNAADKAARAGITTNGTGASTLRVETGATRNARSVWTIPTTGFPGAHFATFSPEIPRRAILAGTSARGQCPACGAPWRRGSERTGRVLASDGRDQYGAYVDRRARGEPTGPQPQSSSNGTAAMPRVERIATDWAPTCTCPPQESIAQLVLDPFLGSGTTAYVARHHGRRAIGIELSESYAKLAADRLKQGTLGLEVY